MSFATTKAAGYAAAATKYGARISAAIPVVNEDGWDDQAHVIASAIAGSQPEKLVFVNALDDLPSAISNVITLEDDTVYLFTDHIDLLGSRLVCGDTTSILGTTSENASITSTGIGSDPLITATTIFVLRNITITSPRGVYFDGSLTPTTAALDWVAVNFVSCSVYSATLVSPSNFIYRDSLVSSGNGFVIEGTVGTVGITESLFIPSSGNTAITVGSSTAVNTRFRMTNCSVVVQSGATGVNVDATAFALPERFILNNVNFSGAGTYLGGATSSSNAALFVRCTGISNSSSASSYSMQANATATTIATPSTFVKVAGSTTSLFSSKFSNTDNRATFTGGVSGLFKVTVTVSLSSGNNNNIDIAVGLNGSVITGSTMRATTSSGGRVESMTTMAISELNTNDYFEVFVANQSAATDITVIDLIVVVERLSA